MKKRLLASLALLSLVAAACGDDEAAAPAERPVTIEVDAESDAVNLATIAYFPDEVKLHPGDTLRFHSNLRGEPHTVTFGTKIDKALEIAKKLEGQEEEGPPPPEFLALKIPFLFPEDEGPPDFTKLQLNQAAGQPCFLASGDVPETGPCTKTAQPAFDGKHALYNSGFLAQDETFTFKLAADIAPGEYGFFCLVHGPEMAGKVVVVSETETASTAAQVAADAKAKIAEIAGVLKPEVDKKQTTTKPEVQAGVGVEEEDGPPGEATVFAPAEISVPAGGTVTWRLGFHTVSFNAPEDARPIVVKDADGTVRLNTKGALPANSPTPPAPSGPPPGEGEGEGPPPPTTINGGRWDGAGFKSSGIVFAPGDVFYKVTFTKAGTYKYVCLIHTDMEGTVKVG